MAAGTRIKLLLFLHDFAPFGAQRVALHIARKADKRKFEVTACSFWGDETLAAEFSGCGAGVVQLKAGRFLDLPAWLRLARLLFSLKPDIVQTNMPELSVPVRLFRLFLPGMAVVHSVQNPFSSEPWYWRLLNRLTLGLCGAAVFCSESIMAEAGLSLPALRRKARAVPNGIEIQPAPAAAGLALRKELGIGEKETVICCVGRLARQKGQSILIEAVARLPAQKRPVRLLLAGDGEDAGVLKSLAAGLGVGNEVIFLGRRSDVPRLLAASDLYAAPSRWEGLDIALGEAMFCRLPCVASAIPGHADILRGGETGLAVPPEDPAALAAGLARLLDDPALAARLAAAGRRLIAENFTADIMAKKYERTYLEAAGRTA